MSTANLDIQRCTTATFESNRQPSGQESTAVCHLNRRFYHTGIYGITACTIVFLQIHFQIARDTAVKTECTCTVQGDFADDFAVTEDHSLAVTGFQNIHHTLRRADLVIILVTKTGHQCILTIGGECVRNSRYIIDVLITAKSVTREMGIELLRTPQLASHQGQNGLRNFNKRNVTVRIIQNIRANCGVILRMQNNIAKFDLINRVLSGQRNGIHTRNIRHIVGIVGAGNVQNILGKLRTDRTKIGCRFRICTEKIFGIQDRILVFKCCQERF